MFIEEKTQGEVQAPVKLEAWQQLLLKAAALIETHGHAKGALHQDDGSLCFRGALNMAANGKAICWGSSWEEGGPAYTAEVRMAAALGLKPNVMSGFDRDVALSLPNWNNAPERIQAEVIAKMRAVALGG